MTSTVFVAVCAKIESGIVFAPATVPVNVGDVIDGDVPKTKLPVPVAPVEVTPSKMVCPTTSSTVDAVAVVVPILTIPAVLICIACACEPVRNRILSVVPAPDVLSSVRVPAAVVLPI